MQQEIDEYLQKGRQYMDEALDHLSRELTKIRTGKASTDMLDGLMVDYYGTPTPISQVGNLTTSDSRTLVIQPWEKSIISEIERSIFGANIGLTPQNDGEVIRIMIPPLTEERRKNLVKQAKGLGEDCKISLRNSRHKMMDFIKKSVKDGYSKDMGKDMEDFIQKTTNEYSDKTDKLIDAKEIDIMTI